MDDSRQSIRVLMVGIGCIIVLMFSLLYLALSHDTQLRETEDKLHTIHEKTELAQVMREAIRKRSFSLAAITKMTDYFERDAEEQRFKAAARDFISAREKLYSLGIGNEEEAILNDFQNAVRDGQESIDLTMSNLVEGLPLENAENLALQAIALQTRQFVSLDQFVGLLKKFSLEQLETTRQESKKERRLLVIIGSLLLLSGVAIAILIVRRERQHLIAMQMEISERKKVEGHVRELNTSLEKRVEDRTNDLSKSEERFSLAMRGANDGLWDWNLKTNDLYLSPRWCRMLGYEREELEPTLETWTSLVNPRDRDRALKEVQDYISGDTDSFETEFNMRHKDGSWVSILSRAFLVHENSEAVRLVGTHVDITERARTQKTLLKLSHALEQSPSVVFITDVEGNIEYVNSMFTEISGYSADEVVGKNPRFLKSDETPPELYADLWQTIKSGNEWRGELKDRCKDGSIFWAHATISSVKDENGVITNFISMHEEITKRKNVESREYEARVKAEIANRAKSELLANMSHELRTPLNAIIGFSQAFQGQLFGPLGNDKYVEYADDINASGNHLLALINDILDMSAIEAGKLELNEAETPLEPIVASSLRLIAPRANSGGISLSSEIPSDLPNIYVDERRLKQILLNLLSNATKFTLPGGSVTFDATVCENNGIVIKIKDTGIGMNEEEVTKAMSEFGQVDSGLDRKEEGSGLGLPLTNSLVKLHGGTLSISSEKGVGTTVTVGFPPERVVRVA